MKETKNRKDKPNAMKALKFIQYNKLNKIKKKKLSDYDNIVEKVIKTESIKFKISGLSFVLIINNITNRFE